MSMNYDRKPGLYWLGYDRNRTLEPAEFCAPDGVWHTSHYWRVIGSSDHLHDDCFDFISEDPIICPLYPFTVPVPVYNPQKLSMDWTVFDPSRGYMKAMQDIKLASGEIVRKVWPNAGVWVCCGDKRPDIPVTEATHVRLTHDENWNG